jgi:hypothetical protein
MTVSNRHTTIAAAVMLRRINDGVTIMKHGHETTGNTGVIWSDESSFTLFPTSGRVYVMRIHKETHSRIPGFNSETWVGSVMLCAAISWYSILLVPLLSFTTEILLETKRE